MAHRETTVTMRRLTTTERAEVRLPKREENSCVGNGRGYAAYEPPT
jgi:hypothetical protein